MQTLYGHTGTITGLSVHGSYILSSSTDGTVRAWTEVEGRGQLLYPWYDLQVRTVALISFDWCVSAWLLLSVADDA